MMMETVKYLNGGRFTSREEWIHPERCLDSFELIVVAEGVAWIEEEERQYEISSGSVLLLEAGKRHLGYRPSRSRVSFYWFHFEDYSPCAYSLVKSFALRDPYAVSILCRQLLHADTADYAPTVRHALLHALLCEVELQGMQSHAPNDALAERVREWIRINSDRGLTVSDISEQFGYNEDYLSRLFRKSFGHGLKAEIDDLRMREIKHLLLESDLTLNEISDRVGIPDYKLFLKFFKYHEGITPSLFRRTYSEMHTNNR